MPVPDIPVNKTRFIYTKLAVKSTIQSRPVAANPGYGTRTDRQPAPWPVGSSQAIQLAVENAVHAIDYPWTVRSKTKTGEGPEVFRLARAHSTQDAVEALERLLKVTVVGIDRSGVGSSHAVYVVDLEDGRRCVARFATHPEHRLAQEVWASERCRQSGLPVPRLLAGALTSADSSPPFAVYEHLPGVAGDSMSLTTHERTAVLVQMGRIAARIHRLAIPGTGALAPQGGGHAGTNTSWAEYVQATLERRIGQLSTVTLPGDLAVLIRSRFETMRPVLEAALPAGALTSALVHGDFRLQNALLTRESDNQIRVNAVLDFEMVLAGDGVVDLAWLDYQDGRCEADLVAILDGYGAAAWDRSLLRRLRLYQLSYALEHLWWMEGFVDELGVARVQQRIRAILADDSTAMPVMPPRAERV